MAFTYNLSDLAKSDAAGRLAQTRLYCTDVANTSDTPNIFADEEINAFLAVTGQDPFQAAAMAFETWARSRGRVALLMKRDGFMVHREAVRWLLAAAETIRQAPLKGQLSVGRLHAPGAEYLDEIRARRARDFEGDDCGEEFISDDDGTGIFVIEG